MKTNNHLKNAKDGLVIFAGAGCSMASPASLPGWTELNDAILDTLWDRLEDYKISNRFREKILTTIKQKRNENKFPPDYQAQLMEERVGINYFELLSVVDSHTFNPVHYYTSLLAQEGFIKAVVTTNFDLNFERAFEELGIPHQVFFDEKGFDLFSENNSELIPIIKIHGSCSTPSSMIDTRKQRLKGRSKSLKNILRHFLHNYPFIFAGFSGQDFDDNDNYLGFKEEAENAKGFIYLNFPGSPIRQSMNELINFYGKSKAESIEYDPAKYLEELVDTLGIKFTSFQYNQDKGETIQEKLAKKISNTQPMDAINMLTSLTEAYGDEISARFIYDKTWKNRFPSDYEADGLSRFLLNHGRSYVFNFQDRYERAESAEVSILFTPTNSESENLNDYIRNPAKQNLKHEKNISPETIGLIALGQTYIANPILFENFPEILNQHFRQNPTKLEQADIIYYYSIYAMAYGNVNESYHYLNKAIVEMEEEFDEPRLSQLLSRRAIIRFKEIDKEILNLGDEDSILAMVLAKKYHDPSLIALANLALAISYRKKHEAQKAISHIRIAMNNYWNLLRIPQYIECVVEYLKIAILGMQDKSMDRQLILNDVLKTKDQVDKYIIERVNLFEPEYCYLIGMIYINYTDAPRSEYLKWFTDAIFLAEQFRQHDNLIFFTETCAQLNILNEVEKIIQARKS